MNEKILVLLARIVEICGTIAFLKLVSNMLSADDLGLYFLGASLVSLATTIVFNPLDQGFLRNADLYERSGTHSARYGSGLILNSSIAILIGVVCLATAREITSALDSLKGPLIVWLTLEVMKNFNLATASALRDRGRILISTAVDYSLKVIVLLLLWIKSAVDLTSVIVVLCSSLALNSGCILYGYRQKLRKYSLSISIDTMRDSLIFCWPMMVWGAFGWSQAMAGRWFLEIHGSLDAVAIYGVMVSLITMPVNALVGVTTTYLFPIIYELDEGDEERSRRYLSSAALLLLPVCLVGFVLLLFFHPNLIIFFTSDTYAGYSGYLPVMYAAAISNGLCSILCGLTFVRRETHKLLLANTLPGLFTFFAGFFYVEKYLLEGAVTIFVIANLLAASLFILTFYQASKASLRSKKI